MPDPNGGPPRGPVLLDRVAEHRPRTRTATSFGWHAAVAIVLAGEEADRLLVIQRTERPGDPWSGDAALPGGKREDRDDDLVATARRETMEEVGVELPARPVGRLDDVGGRTHPGVVTPYVFHLPATVETVAEPREVARALWLPRSVLTSSDHRTRTPTRAGPFPAWEYDGLTIWGLTRRVLRNLVDVLGTPRE